MPLPNDSVLVVLVLMAESSGYAADGGMTMTLICSSRELQMMPYGSTCGGGRCAHGMGVDLLLEDVALASVLI